VHHLQAGRAVEHLAQKVRGRARAVRRKAHLVALRLGPGNELGQRVGGHVLVDDQRQLEAGRVEDRHEVLDRVVRQVAVGAGKHAHHAGRAQQQHVAVGRRRLHGLDRDAARRARAVVDDQRAERVAHLLRNGARQHVLRAAGGHADQHLDGLAGHEGGLGLSLGQRCGGRERKGTQRGKRMAAGRVIGNQGHGAVSPEALFRSCGKAGRRGRDCGRFWRRYIRLIKSTIARIYPAPHPK
jgi:hypothetical protein